MQAQQSHQTLDIATAIRQGDANRVNNIICDTRDEHEKSALMAKGAQVDLEDNHCDEGDLSALDASQGGRREVVKMVLEKNAQVDLQDLDNEGWSALMHASWNGHCEEVRLLLAQVDLKNEKGHSGLVHASRKGHSEMVKILLEKGAQVDLQDGKGHFALMYASQNGHCEVVKLLLEKNAQVDLQDGFLNACQSEWAL